MGVVSTGVHTSFMSGNVIHSGCFLYGKCVHVCTKCNGPARPASGDICDNAAVGFRTAVRDSKLFQFFYYVLLCLWKHLTDLRNLVQFSSHLNQSVLQCFAFFPQIHSDILPIQYKPMLFYFHVCIILLPMQGFRILRLQ